MKLFKKLFNLFIISNIFILYLTNSGCKMYSGISINESNYYSDDFNKNFEIFESRIEELRNKYHIPSISAGIIKNDSLAWYKGFGFANIEDSIVPNKNTIYHIASLTKPFTSTLIMQLVDEGKVSLNDPVSKYGIKIKGLRKIKVKHFLSHTSGGKIWKSFKYSSGRFGKLEEIIEKSSGISFGENMLNRIIKPLDLQNTAPNYQDTLNFKLTGYNLQNYLNKLACCGAGTRSVDQDTAIAMAHEKIVGAELAGAEGLVTICPTCYVQFDVGQRLMAKQFEKTSLPVFVYPELLGIAMGIDLSVGFKMHTIKVKDFLEKVSS